MSASNLGRLQQVELREAWFSESGDFTPWLAQESNLMLLGQTIGLELECEAQEKGVGPFRADILCRDTADESWVLIENQLEKTDHNHLGQLLTYAAGLKAVTIVWVAARFTEEHRAALDWLNEITDDRFNFFGLEIELWRIGQSPVAPKFNVISKPNGWSRAIAEAGELTETNRLYLEYWQALKEHLEANKSPVRMAKPLAQAWMTFPIGRSLFHLTASVSRQKRTGFAQLNILGADHVQFFGLLKRDAPAIEPELGFIPEWRELPDGKESHIRHSFGEMSVENRADWPRQQTMFRESLEAQARCYRQRVKALDLADSTEDEAPMLVP